MKFKILTLLVLVAITATVASEDKKKVDPWLPMADRVKVWDAVVSRELGLPLPLKEPKPYRVESNNIEATFEKDGATWTIMGAAARGESHCLSQGVAEQGRRVRGVGRA
jgi:hypothetical protein